MVGKLVGGCRCDLGVTLDLGSARIVSTSTIETYISYLGLLKLIFYLFIPSCATFSDRYTSLMN